MNVDLPKVAFVSLCGIFGFFSPTIPFAGVIIAFIIADCLSAFDLSRRLRKKHPEQVTGKFQSKHAMKMVKTFLQMYGAVLLAQLVEQYVIPMHKFSLPNYTAFVFCAVQAWSILENISSENGQAWARLLQKFMVNKAKRHFDIDLDELKENENG